MTAHAKRATAKPLPEHDYANDHRLLAARSEFSRRRLRNAADLIPSGELAADRIREYGHDLGYEYNGLEYGWMAEAARQLGLNEDTGRRIFNTEQRTVTTDTVDKVSLHTGIPPRCFYDRES